MNEIKVWINIKFKRKKKFNRESKEITCINFISIKMFDTNLRSANRQRNFLSQHSIHYNCFMYLWISLLFSHRRLFSIYLCCSTDPQAETFFVSFLIFTKLCRKKTFFFAFFKNRKKFLFSINNQYCLFLGPSKL